MKNWLVLLTLLTLASCAFKESKKTIPEAEASTLPEARTLPEPNKANAVDKDASSDKDQKSKEEPAKLPEIEGQFPQPQVLPVTVSPTPSPSPITAKYFASILVATTDGSDPVMLKKPLNQTGNSFAIQKPITKPETAITDLSFFVTIPKLFEFESKTQIVAILVDENGGINKLTPKVVSVGAQTPESTAVSVSFESLDDYFTKGSCPKEIRLQFASPSGEAISNFSFTFRKTSQNYSISYGYADTSIFNQKGLSEYASVRIGEISLTPLAWIEITNQEELPLEVKFNHNPIGFAYLKRKNFEVSKTDCSFEAHESESTEVLSRNNFTLPLNASLGQNLAQIQNGMIGKYATNSVQKIEPHSKLTLGVYFESEILTQLFEGKYKFKTPETQNLPSTCHFECACDNILFTDKDAYQTCWDISNLNQAMHPGFYPDNGFTDEKLQTCKSCLMTHDFESCDYCARLESEQKRSVCPFCKQKDDFSSLWAFKPMGFQKVQSGTKDLKLWIDFLEIPLRNSGVYFETRFADQPLLEDPFVFGILFPSRWTLFEQN